MITPGESGSSIIFPVMWWPIILTTCDSTVTTLTSAGSLPWKFKRQSLRRLLALWVICRLQNLSVRPIPGLHGGVDGLLSPVGCKAIFACYFNPKMEITLAEMKGKPPIRPLGSNKSVAFSCIHFTLGMMLISWLEFCRVENPVKPGKSRHDVRLHVRRKALCWVEWFNFAIGDTITYTDIHLDHVCLDY